MKLFEVQVLAGKATLFNPDHDDKPSGKTYANEIERVGIYSLNMADQYALLEFYNAIIMLNYGDDLAKTEELELYIMNERKEFAKGIMGKLLFRVGVVWIG